MLKECSQLIGAGRKPLLNGIKTNHENSIIQLYINKRLKNYE